MCLSKMICQAVVMVLMFTVLAVLALCLYGSTTRLELATVALVGATCLTTTLVSLIALAVLTRKRPDWLVQGCMAAGVARLLLTLAAGGMVWLIWRPPAQLFGLAVVLCYLMLLAWETTIAVRLAHRYYSPPAAGDAAALGDIEEPDHNE